MMIKRSTFATLTLAIAALGLAGSAYIGWDMHAAGDSSLRLSHAAWKVKFNAPSELPRGVDAIALATAVSSGPGRLAFSDNGEDSLPFEEVTFEVSRGIKGLRAGEQFILERAGGIDYEGQNVILDADGGPFEMGATYLLFLQRQEDGPFWYQVNDQGRYRVEEDRLVAAVPDDPVASFYDGRRLEEGMGLIGDYLGRNPVRRHQP
jgi:hypothetical protein